LGWARPSAAAISRHKPLTGSTSCLQPVIFVAAPVCQAVASRYFSGLNRLVANMHFFFTLLLLSHYMKNKDA